MSVVFGMEMANRTSMFAFCNTLLKASGNTHAKKILLVLINNDYPALELDTLIPESHDDYLKKCIKALEIMLHLPVLEEEGAARLAKQFLWKFLENELLPLLEIHPISNLYVSNLKPVWNECHRILRPSGILLASFYNPVLFVFARDKALETQGLLKPQFSLPYADTVALDQKSKEEKIQNHEALIFGHTLTSQINGQLEAGFLLAGFYEDEHPSPRFLIEKFMKTMIATRAVKY